MNNKIYKKLFGGFGFVIIVSLLTLFVMSQTYIQNLVYHERLSQMEEVTHQMFHSLEDVIDNHWDEVNVQCNYLYYTPLETDTDLYRYLKKLSELSNYHEKQTELIAVDSAGHYYTENGRMGLLREMTYLEDAPEPQRPDLEYREVQVADADLLSARAGVAGQGLEHADLYDVVAAGLGVVAVICIRVGRCRCAAFAAAGRESEHHSESKQQSSKLFHDFPPCNV